VTARDIVTRALKTLGVLAAGETPTAEDASDALDALNDMVDSWQLERLFIHEIVRTVKTLAASTATYTIGTGGAINVTRPTWIDAARVILDLAATTPTEIPIEVFSDQKWQDIRQKTLTSSLIQGIWFDHAWSAGLGLIYVWPIPTTGTTRLVIYAPGLAVGAFVDLNTDYTFPPGYRDALHYSLAVRLAPEFGKPLDGLVAQLAVDSLAKVKRANHRPRELACDPAITARRGYFDWRTGGYR